LRVPLALLEVNSLPGFTNRGLARRARLGFIAFAETADRLRCPTIVTGNPVRREVRVGPMESGKGPLRLLVIGGSQGAVGLNSLVIDALPRLKAAGERVRITHQSGKLDYERVRAAYGEIGVSARIEPFIDDMATAYRQAEMVICRAGATTVAELVAARRPAILVPLPSAADNHQEFNAMALVNVGGGVLMRQKESDGSRLAEEVLGWYDRRSELPRMGEALGKLDHPDAAARIADELFALAGKGN
jgi:UDP-N-acetylglucosamine--N-acetylmuramyl-(pentapeptide) pyrophosphoryl-undecaprenol N-acetylglucosamine transferase